MTYNFRLGLPNTFRFNFLAVATWSLVGCFGGIGGIGCIVGCTPEAKIERIVLASAQNILEKEIEEEASRDITVAKDFKNDYISTIKNNSEFEFVSATVRDGEALANVRVRTVPEKARAALRHVINGQDLKNSVGFNYTDSLRMVTNSMFLPPGPSYEMIFSYELKNKSAGWSSIWNSAWEITKIQK
ncbi:MAG: hypothetical protein C5B49_03295 [Bdellovibrio sp.]|nr:MAG: hypothetical protein C5B49_03295 [Bdellovibrio sp.]